MSRRRPPVPSSSSFGMRNLDGRMMGWMDGKDDHPRILYNLKHYKWYNFNFVAFYGILMNM
jgi:hypothetical protein